MRKATRGASVIVPRWEWRTFGTRLGPAEDHLADLATGGVLESDELYLLSAEGDNVKVRDGIMDIKVLREVDRHGLELWEPVLKARFPLAADAVAAVFGALRRPLPPLAREAYTLEQLLDELVGPAGGVRVVQVHKRRSRCTIGDCTGELCAVEAGGRRTRTIAIEGEDPTAVLAAVRAVGLAERGNTNFPSGLMALIDDVPPGPTLLELGAISFRRVTRADFPILARWLAEPHVARWWNHESGLDAVERDFGPAVEGAEPSEDHLVLFERRPVGLIQCCRFADYPEYIDEMAPVYPVPEDAVTIDYLIGDPGLMGRGLGRAMLASFVERIWRTDPATSCVVVPVASANEASWRALRSVGFRVVARGLLTPDNPIDDGSHEILRLDRPVT